MISIGEKIREARIARNLTQKELGNVLGLNEEVIINYENNKIKLDLDRLIEIIDTLDMNSSDIASLIEIDQKHYKNLRDYEHNKRDEFYKKYSEKAIAGKRAKTINSQAALKELTEVLNEVLVGRLDAIYNEREKMFQQGNYEEVQFRDYEIFKNRYYSEIKEKFFEEVNNNVKNTIEDSFSNIELYMKNYFNEKKNNEIMRRNIKAVETFVILKEIFKRNEIQWALLDITNRIEKSQSNNFTIIIEKTQYKMALALLNIIALKIDGTTKRKIYKLNNIKFNVTTEVKDNEEVYNLKNYKIKYYLIENERIPGLIKRNK